MRISVKRYLELYISDCVLLDLESCSEIFCLRCQSTNATLISDDPVSPKSKGTHYKDCKQLFIWRKYICCIIFAFLPKEENI